MLGDRSSQAGKRTQVSRVVLWRLVHSPLTQEGADPAYSAPVVGGHGPFMPQMMPYRIFLVSRAEDPLQFRAMILVTAAAFILFLLRDYWLLQLGPARSVAWRVWVYAGLVTMAGLSVWLLGSTENPGRFVSAIESPPWLIGLFAFHSIAAVVCFWMKRAGRYDLAWLAAMVPAPVAWVLFARVLFSSNESMSSATKGAIVSAFAALWILPIVLPVLRGRLLEMGIEDLDYVLGFAGWINCFGAGLVVLAISPATVESFEVAIRALSVH